MMSKKIKYRNTLIALGLFFCLPVKAGGGRFGLIAGANIANISPTPDEAFQSRTGIVAGGFYEFLVSPFIGLSSEFLIASKGGKRVSDDVLLKITYFEVPLLLKVHLGARRLGFLFFGGPTVGFVTSSSGQTSDGSDLGLTNLYPNEMGVQVGGGVEFPLSKAVGIQLSGRYSIGLSDISQAANNYKNNGIYILGSMTFRFEDEDQYTDTEIRAKEFLKRKYSPETQEEAPIEETRP